MVDWMSIEEITKDGVAFGKFMHALLGLYIWEWFTSLPFDWDYVTRKRQFRWPMIFYFLNRYCLLFALIGIAISLNVVTPVDCQSLYTFNQCFGNASIGLASINLSLRTMAVWSQKWFVVVPLVLVIMGHWSLLLHGILLKADYIPGQGCVITNTNSALLAATFIYTMCFDFSVLTLTAWKLVRSGPSASQAMGRSKLSGMIFGDGLIFFIIAFLSNLLATVFMLLNLNPVMSIIANVPAAIASTIVACRAVRRLSNFTSAGPERFQSSNNSSSAFRAQRSAQTAAVSKPKFPSTTASEGGVHVQMETFTANSPMTDKTLVYDAVGNVIKREDSEYGHDLEGQEIKDDFKRTPI